MAVPLISRTQWGARQPKKDWIFTTWAKRKVFMVHYSAGPTTQTVRDIQNFHMDVRNWSDIGYNFVVDHRGNAYFARGWLAIGAHAANHNTEGVGVCFIGRAGDLTDHAKRTINGLYADAVAHKGGPLTWQGHRDANPTECPGDELYAWIRAGHPDPPIPARGEDEMPYLTIRHRDKAPVYALFASGRVRHIGPAEFDWLQKAKVPHVLTEYEEETNLLARLAAVGMP